MYFILAIVELWILNLGIRNAPLLNLALVVHPDCCASEHIT